MSEMSQESLLEEIKKTVRATMPTYSKDYVAGSPAHENAVIKVSKAVFDMLKCLSEEE